MYDHQQWRSSNWKRDGLARNVSATKENLNFIIKCGEGHCGASH